MKIYIKSSSGDTTYAELKSRINKATTQSELEEVEDDIISAYQYDIIAKGDYRELMRLVDDIRYEIMYSPTDDEVEPYRPSATKGDYSPSSPWNAPGMSVSDFI